MISNSDFKYSSIIEGAYLLVITQNVLFLSKPIISFFLHKINLEILILLMSLAIINLGNLISNWISTKETSDNYSSKLLFFDIISLAILAVFTQVGTDFFNEQYNLIIAVETIMFIYAITYLLLYISFFGWNILCVKENYDSIRLTIDENSMNTGNLLILFYCMGLIGIIITYCINKMVVMNILFLWSSIFSLIILIRYYVVCVFNKHYSLSCKATWHGGLRKTIVQLFISLKSLFIFAITRKWNNQEEKIKKYFKNIYSGRTNDEYLFDSSQNGYLDKLKKIIDMLNLEGDEIVDLGCGNNYLYNWLKQENVNIKKYYGYDFARNNTSFDNAVISNNNIVSATIDYTDKCVFIINVLCYLSPSQVKVLFSKLSAAKKIIIIEPTKSLYWDATFNKIRLYYRTKQKIASLLNGFMLNMQCTDYFIKFCEIYLFPMSSCYVFENTTNVVK